MLFLCCHAGYLQVRLAVLPCLCISAGRLLELALLLCHVKEKRPVHRRCQVQDVFVTTAFVPATLPSFYPLRLVLAEATSESHDGTLEPARHVLKRLDFVVMVRLAVFETLSCLILHSYRRQLVRGELPSPYAAVHFSVYLEIQRIINIAGLRVRCPMLRCPDSVCSH